MSCTFFNIKRPIDRRVIERVISPQAVMMWRVWIFVLSVFFVTFSTSIQAGDEKVYRFDIPAQSLSESLGVISQVTGRFFLFPYDLVENKKSKRLPFF